MLGIGIGAFLKVGMLGEEGPKGGIGWGRKAEAGGERESNIKVKGEE